MKKFLYLMMAMAVMSAGFVSCGDDDDDDNGGSVATSSGKGKGSITLDSKSYSTPYGYFSDEYDAKEQSIDFFISNLNINSQPSRDAKWNYASIGIYELKSSTLESGEYPAYAYVAIEQPVYGEQNPAKSVGAEGTVIVAKSGDTYTLDFEATKLFDADDDNYKEQKESQFKKLTIHYKGKPGYWLDEYDE